jgi:hypothetical protein
MLFQQTKKLGVFCPQGGLCIRHNTFILVGPLQNTHHHLQGYTWLVSRHDTLDRERRIGHDARAGAADAGIVNDNGRQA